MMIYEYDKNNLKQSLTIEDIRMLVADLYGEPILFGEETLHCKTICHHSHDELSDASHKLYYYDNTKLFHCYSGCEEATFDIFELVRKVKSQESNTEWPLPKAIEFVAEYFGVSGNEIVDEDTLEDWDLFNSLDKLKDAGATRIYDSLKTYDGSFMKHLPHVHITTWENDGISKDAMDTFGICYEPKNQVILIPHYDLNGAVIGIRQRTLIQEDAEKFGKYRPFKLGKTMFNHPLGLALYGLYQNKENIQRAKRAIILESEKSVLQYETMYGRENNIAVACCGSSVSLRQIWMLIACRAEEIIIGLDHDFEDVNSKEAKRIIKNLKNIYKKFGQYVTISMIWDKNNLTGLKASPTDEGKEIFVKLYKSRINLYGLDI